MACTRKPSVFRRCAAFLRGEKDFSPTPSGPLGAKTRDRTGDLFLTMEVLYRLSYLGKSLTRAIIQHKIHKTKPARATGQVVFGSYFYWAAPVPPLVSPAGVVTLMLVVPPVPMPFPLNPNQKARPMMTRIITAISTVVALEFPSLSTTTIVFVLWVLILL